MDYVVSYLSIEFGLCFILFFVLYWGLGFSLRLQNVLLLVASYAILASFSLNFLYILLGYTALVYLLGLLSQRYPGRGWVNGLMLLLVLGAFYLFKYQDFFTSTVQNAFAQFGVEVSLPLLEVLLPVGLSFYAFHSVSYLVSINRRELTPGSPFDLALYLAFFPSLIAGPVNRAIPMLAQINPPQLRQVLEPQRALGLIAVAVVKLFFLSSWLANEWVDPVFDSPVAYSAEQILRAVYGYSFLIYFNFSGYTDLVTGIALLLGFRLPQNFNYPYAARNLKEFWGRWHISLSTFIRDYVYIPLGGQPWPGVARQPEHAAGDADFRPVARRQRQLHHLGRAARYRPGPVQAVQPAAGPGPELDRRRPHGAAADLPLCGVRWIFFRCATLSDAMDMLKGLGELSLGGLLGGGASLLGCLLFVAFYPRIVALLRRLFDAATGLPWLFYPVPLGLFICVVIFASPSGVPGFIYASF